jgi:hypothetical protein
MAFPLLLLSPLSPCKNVGNNDDNNNDNNSGGGNEDGHNGGNNSCVGGCMPLFLLGLHTEVLQKTG